MGEIPGFLLVHTLTVEAYRAWNTYAAPDTFACFVDERLGTGGPTGTQRVESITVYAPLDTDLPAGSRITLADGRRGYCSAMVRLSGGGLPVPDHLEAAVSVAGAYGPAYGETIIVLHRTRSRSAAGAVTVVTDRTEVPGAAIKLLNQSEAALGAATQQVDTVEVVVAPDTVVVADDLIEVRGLTYEVDGTPEAVTDPNSVARPGIRIIGKRRH